MHPYGSVMYQNAVVLPMAQYSYSLQKSRVLECASLCMLQHRHSIDCEQNWIPEKFSKQVGIIAFLHAGSDVTGKV